MPVGFKITTFLLLPFSTVSNHLLLLNIEFAAQNLFLLPQWHKCCRWLELFAFARRVGYVERSNEPEWVTAGLYSTALVLPCKTSIVRVLNDFA
jgi:hypothetical protein